MLSVKHVTKKYYKTIANDNICMEIPDGVIAVLLGPNGAGKSTLMKCMTGFLKYDGRITVGGFENKTTEAKRLLGYVPEMPALYSNLTVEEHLEFIARIYRLKDYKPYMEELLTRFELQDKRKKFGDELSKGMQQKLSICCALLPKPRMMLFDEPMIGLDPHAIKELKKLFLELKEEGCSILISTHMIDSVENLWDMTCIMMNGRVAAKVTKEEVEAGGKTLEEQFFEITEGNMQPAGAQPAGEEQFVAKEQAVGEEQSAAEESFVSKVQSVIGEQPTGEGRIADEESFAAKEHSADEESFAAQEHSVGEAQFSDSDPAAKAVKAEKPEEE